MRKSAQIDLDGPTTGALPENEIDQLLAKSEMADHIELPTGDRLPLGELPRSTADSPHRSAQAFDDRQQFYLAIGSRLGNFSSVTEFIEQLHQDDIQILVEGEDTWQKISKSTRSRASLSSALAEYIPTTAAQPKTAAAEQSRKDITVNEGRRYSLHRQILQGAREGLIDGDALATRPGMPGATPPASGMIFENTVSVSLQPKTRHAPCR